MTKEPRNEKIEAKCTKSELAKVLQLASDNNMSVAELIRARVLYEHAPKYTLFELRVMKILSAHAAWLELDAEKFTEVEFDEFVSRTKIIEQKNDVGDGIDLGEKDSTNNRQ